MQATPGLPKPSDTSRSTGRMCHDRPPNIVFDVTGGPVGGTRRDVPFRAAVWRATAVVLSRRSGRGGMRVIAECLRSQCRRRSRITSLPASDLYAREADSGWQRSRKLQHLQRHMGSAFKCCQPLRLCRSEPAASRGPS
jgi:hypothetical protein